MVATFKFNENRLIVGLASGDQTIEDAGKFVGRVFDGFGCTMPGSLFAVIIAQVGLIVLKRKSSQSESLRGTVSSFVLDGTNASSGAETVFGAQIEPGRKTVDG